jgi:hypothetical protein
MIPNLWAHDVNCARQLLVSLATRFALVIIFHIVFSLTVPTAEAAGIATTGDVTQIAPPASVALGALESNTEVRLFAERTALLLSQSVTVDVTQPGLVDGAEDLTPGAITANQLVSSYLLHADAIGNGQPIVMFQGSVTFDMPVLGALITASRLTPTDSVLGSLATVYNPTVNRGFEFGVAGQGVSDSLVLSPDRLTVSFVFRTTSQYDQVRIVTSAIPEPTSVYLGGSGCVGIALSLLVRRSRSTGRESNTKPSARAEGF